MAVTKSIYFNDTEWDHLASLAEQMGKSETEIAKLCIERTTLADLVQDEMERLDHLVELRRSMEADNAD